jgi:hypothetical protein
MTRGTLYLIEMIKDKLRVTNSCEFNGDMYPEGHGRDVMKGLDKVKNKKEFIKFVNQFNDDNFEYERDDYYKFYITHPKPGTWLEKQGNLVIVSFKDYFENFFSDWTFWKNCTTDCEIQFFTYKYAEHSDKRVSDKVIKLSPNECVAINFGHYEENYKGGMF